MAANNGRLKPLEEKVGLQRAAPSLVESVIEFLAKRCQATLNTSKILSRCRQVDEPNPARDSLGAKTLNEDPDQLVSLVFVHPWHRRDSDATTTRKH